MSHFLAVGISVVYCGDKTHNCRLTKILKLLKELQLKSRIKTKRTNNNLEKVREQVSIRLSVKLSFVEHTAKKLGRILRSHKLRSTFYSESTLRKRIYLFYLFFLSR